MSNLFGNTIMISNLKIHYHKYALFGSLNFLTFIIIIEEQENETFIRIDCINEMTNLHSWIDSKRVYDLDLKNSLEDREFRKFEKKTCFSSAKFLVNFCKLIIILTMRSQATLFSLFIVLILACANAKKITAEECKGRCLHSFY